MSRIKNYLMGEVEAGKRKYNPLTCEYQSTESKLVKYYTVYLEGMDLGLRFINKEDAMERAGSFGLDASIGYVMELKK